VAPIPGEDGRKLAILQEYCEYWAFPGSDEYLAGIHCAKIGVEGKLASILAEMGDDGWDLKGIYSEALTMHTHLIFGREKT